MADFTIRYLFGLLYKDLSVYFTTSLQNVTDQFELMNIYFTTLQSFMIVSSSKTDKPVCKLVVEMNFTLKLLICFTLQIMTHRIYFNFMVICARYKLHYGSSSLSRYTCALAIGVLHK